MYDEEVLPLGEALPAWTRLVWIAGWQQNVRQGAEYGNIKMVTAGLVEFNFSS